nr:MAG TPA: hypothetical protein [Caudoviricetes sp.]
MRNRAGRSHAARVLLRAKNSPRSFRGPARKPGSRRITAKGKAAPSTGRLLLTVRKCPAFTISSIIIAYQKRTFRTFRTS